MKKRIYISVVLLLVLVVAIISYTNTGGKRVSEIGKFKVNDITKIDFQYNSGAIKAGSIEDKGKVNEFMNYLNSCSLKKKSTPLEVVGYYQLLVLYTENKEVMRIMTYDKFIEINGIQYNMVKNKLNLEKIDDLIKSL